MKHQHLSTTSASPLTKCTESYNGALSPGKKKNHDASEGEKEKKKKDLDMEENDV